ncbi:hypothetical protein [Streptomyces wuyuanensis]|uniref:hypothetical protein n=1 Tax=Streptomyces wuyuanensis TaxID=1196353 RepID=UPI00378C7E1A
MQTSTSIRFTTRIVALGAATALAFGATSGMANATEADNARKAQASATAQAFKDTLSAAADAPAPEIQYDGLEDRFLALPANPSMQQVVAAMYPDDPAAQKEALAHLTAPTKQQGAKAPAAGFGLGTAWKVTKCVGAIGAFVAGNAVMISKLRKLGGVYKGAKLVVQAGNFQDRMKALGAMFGEVTGLSMVASNCG